jgi:hypothetical protein
MPTPSLLSPHERGKRWRQEQVQQMLAANAVALAPLRADGEPACSWGRGPETGTTLYVRLASDPEPKVLRFRRTMIADCGAGRYCSQQAATMFIRRTLQKMGIFHLVRVRGASMAKLTTLNF